MSGVSFIEALNDRSMDMLRLIPKSDLHNHAGRGGCLREFNEMHGLNIAPAPARFDSLADMDEWFTENVKNAVPGLEGLIMRWEASFRQAARDGVAVLALAFSTRDINMAGGAENFIAIIDRCHHLYGNDAAFYPELSYDRTCDIELETDRLDEILSYNWFRSIDICNHEFARKAAEFKPLYRKAEARGLRLKAHVGEIGSAEDVWEAVCSLGLHEIHHGIAAAASPYVMRRLADNKIRMNISPTSNIALKLAGDYKNHPIKALYRAGICVTINSDDMMVFGQSVSREFLNLYVNGTFTAEELDEIRLNGLGAGVVYH
jgi:adenosine deaminase